MGFLAPWFLAGAAALAVPLYLHLLRRHTSNPQPFSSLMFFEQRTQSSIKHRRLRYLPLLALRLSLLALLVLAFAGPFINRPAVSAANDKLVMLVVDNSFSMRAGSRLADAKREAESVLASRNPAERAQVMALGSQLQVLTQPTQDAATLSAAVSSIEPGDARGNFGELARALRSAAQSASAPIELHFFSDMQKSDMPANFADAVLPANVTLVLHPVVKSVVPNWAVESVNAPGQVWDVKKARVQAVIAGYGTPAATRTVTLVVNGKTAATRTVAVPAGGRATVEFDSLDVPHGFSRCEVRIDSADALPEDDVSRFAVERSDPQKVLFLHESGDTRSPLYFGAALAAAAESAFTMESIPVDQAANVRPSDYAFVVLSDVVSLPASLESALTRYVRAGGSVLVAAGTSTGRLSRIPVFDAGVRNALYYTSAGGIAETVGDTDPSYAAIGKADRWSGVKFYFAVKVDDTGSRVVARLADQTPLLLEKQIGEGRVLLLASGLDNLTNDFPLHPDFVPFVEQTAFYLSGTARRTGSRLVDSFIDLRTSKEEAVGVEVIDPEGRRPLSLKEATSAQTYQVTQAGFYELRLANGRQDVIGVNPDRRESDLEVLAPDVLSLWTGKGAAEPGDASQAQAAASGPAEDKTKPYGLWWYVMLLALAAALAESWVASRYLGIRREDS
ncbi:MAG: BatA and WFA domain-containing protein [Candidatus Acidiferrales bacterium]